MYISGIFALCTAIVMNITAQVPFVGFLPVVKWIDLVINIICVIFCIILFIHPGNKILTYIMFFTEAGVTVHMGFIGIGTLLFASGCTICFVNGDFKTHYKQKLTFLLTYWAVISIGLYFSFNIKMFIFEISLTLFYFGLLFCLYKKLESNLAYLLPPTEIVSTEIPLPPKGSILKLSNYGLSDRQKDFIFGSFAEGKTYEELAAEHHVSISVVKKDMAAACKNLGVANREALRILLLQYTYK